MNEEKKAEDRDSLMPLMDAAPPVKDNVPQAMEEDDDDETQMYSQDLLANTPSQKSKSVGGSKHSSNSSEKSKATSPSKSKTTELTEQSAKALESPSRPQNTNNKEKKTKWMSSTRHNGHNGHQPKADTDCSSPRLLMPSFKSNGRKSNDNVSVKKPAVNANNKNATDEDDSDDESLSGPNGHNNNSIEEDPIIENTQDEHEKKRPSAFKRLARSSARDKSKSSIKFSPQTNERRSNKSTTATTASKGKDTSVCKPKILRYEAVSKNDDNALASASVGPDSSEAEFSDDDEDVSTTNHHLSQTDIRIKKQLREIKAVLPSAEEMRDMRARKELSDELVALKKSHKTAINKLKREKGKLATQLKNAEEVIKQKDAVIREKNKLMDEQFAVIALMKESVQAAPPTKRSSSPSEERIPPPATAATTKAKKRKKKEEPVEDEVEKLTPPPPPAAATDAAATTQRKKKQVPRESDEEESDSEDELPISALKNAPTSSSKKKRRKSYGRHTNTIVVANTLERRLSGGGGDTSSVDTPPVSNKTSVKCKSGSTSVAKQSTETETDGIVLSTEVWKKLQERGWKYKSGPEPHNMGELFFSIQLT